jgi:hypothetical protein
MFVPLTIDGILLHHALSRLCDAAVRVELFARAPRQRAEAASATRAAGLDQTII